MVSRHQGCPRRRAEGTDVEVGETNRFGIETIDIRRLQDWIAVATEVTVALIVSHDEDDIGLGLFGGL